MSYLKNYGTKNRKFQEGGAMMAEEAPMAPAPMAPEAGPEAGGQEEQILALAEATMQGDQEAAAQLGQLLAPMIMQEVQANAGGAPAPGPEAGAQPVFRKGGKFVGTTR
jgi:hypothetical protein